jgi:hypothetical protein
MSSRWVYHHRRENRRLTGTRSPGTALPTLALPGTKPKHHTTFCHDRFVLLYYLFLVGPADYLLVDTISVVIWEWERNYAIPTSGSHFRRIRLYNTFMLAIVQSKFFLFLRSMLLRNGLNRERWSYPRLLMVIPSAVRIQTCDHYITLQHTNYKSSHFTHHCLLQFQVLQ